MSMKSRDFSRPVGARRLRVALHHYEADSRQFRHVKGSGALVTVKNLSEQRRLWRAIEKTIAAGEWKRDDGTDPRTDSGDLDAGSPGPGGLGVPA